MNQKKRLNRRIIISSIMLIIICSIFSSQSLQTTHYADFYQETPQTPISSAFSGEGRNFQITQHATAISSTYDVNPTTLSSFTLTGGWYAENITIDAENVTRYRNLVQNPTCDYDYGQSEYTNWEYYTSNSPQLPLNEQSNRLSLDVGYGTITPDEIAYFNQTINIDEEEVSIEMVELSFDARMYGSPGDAGLYLFGSIIIGGVEHNYTIDTTTDTTEIYQTYNMQYYLSDVGQELPNDIEFRFGAYVNQTLVYGSDPTHNDVHFDNIEFNVYTYVNQTHALIAQDQDDFTDYYYTNTSSGQGEFTFTGQKSYGSTQDIEFQIRQNSTLEGLVEIENLTITSDLIRTINTSSSSYQDGAFGNSDDILWTFDASPSIPASYVNKWVDIEKPDDWEIVSVVDPFFTNQTSSCINLEYGTTKFIIPVSVFSSGEWEIRARSKSSFDEAKLEYWDGDSFEEKSDFYIGEEFHVRVDINDTITFSNTEINFTIYYPNGTIYYNQSEEPSSYEYYFGNFTIGLDNMSVGLYTAEVTWTNNLSSSYVDNVGYKTFDFGVFHNTQLTTVDTLIETVPGEPLLILVQFEDTDRGEGIDLATVQYNSTFGDDGYLTYIGSGYYFLELDTTLYDYTDYYLSFNASKTYYENQTESNFIQLSIEREGMILDVPRQVNSVSANSYAQFDFNLTGEISEAFLTADSITTDWIAWYEVIEQAQGQYQLNVTTTGITTSSFPETFIINIEANKTDYTNITDVVILQVNPIETYITANQTFVEVAQGSPFTIKVNLTEIGPETLVSGVECDVTWSLGTTITPIGNEFEIEYITTGLALDQYSSIITLNRSGYQTKTVIISVLVNPVQTVISANVSFIRLSQGEQFTVKVNYTEYSSGALIPASTCTVTWELGVYYEINTIGNEYEITFNTTGLDLDQYTAIVKVNKTGYETKNVFVTVLVEPIYTNLTLSENFLQISQGDTFNITIDYIEDIGGNRVANSMCTITWERPFISSNTTFGFEIEFDSTGLDLGQYVITIKCNSSGYEIQTAFLTILVEPIQTSILASDSIITIVQGDFFNISVDYTENAGGLRVPNSDCNITWDASSIISNSTNGFEIEFSTAGLELGQYIATILCYSSGYTTQSHFVTVLIEPITTTISISNVTVTSYSDRIFNITVDYEEEISGSPVTGADLMITWTGTYTYVSTVSGFEINFNTTGMSVGQYSATIQVNRSGWESQTTFVIVQINDLPSNLELTSEIEFTKGDQVIISVNFTVDGVVFPIGTIQVIGDIEGTLLWNGSNYVFEFDSSDLDPQLYFCRIIAQAAGVQTSELEIFINIKPVDRNMNLAWWIAGSVSGTALLGLMSLFILNRYVKQTRFQRDVAFLKKNLAKPGKTKNLTEPSRDKTVSDIINKEIDQLL